MSKHKPELIVRGLTKQFNGPDGVVSAVDSVDLELCPGEIGAVHGSSGCGKTTLLLMCGGLLRPFSGEVELFGTKIYELNERQRVAYRAKHIGFVFQQFHLIPYLSVLENVMAATLALEKRVDTEERARAILDELQMSARLKHTPGCLSTGERQRVALARALINGPSLILADEPTGNLDAENGKIVMRRLRSFCDDGGMVLVVTHDERMHSFADWEYNMARHE